MAGSGSYDPQYNRLFSPQHTSHSPITKNHNFPSFSPYPAPYVEIVGKRPKPRCRPSRATPTDGRQIGSPALMFRHDMYLVTYPVPPIASPHGIGASVVSTSPLGIQTIMLRPRLSSCQDIDLPAVQLIGVLKRTHAAHNFRSIFGSPKKDPGKLKRSLLGLNSELRQGAMRKFDDVVVAWSPWQSYLKQL